MNVLIAWQKNATTTPATRLAIHQSTGSNYVVAAPYGASRDTARKWRARDSVADGSHTPHRLQATLNAGQEELVIDLRRPLGVKYLPQMANEGSRCYVFVAIDQATRWVLISIAKARTAAAAGRFLKTLASKAPFRIETVLTDNGTEFTDRLFGCPAKEPSGEHGFDWLCEALDMDHRLTRVCGPQTNGMVEHFNGRIEQILHTVRFDSAEDLHATLHRYVWLYDEPLPQKAVQRVAPVRALKDWQKSHPEMSIGKLRSQPEYDTVKIDPRYFRPTEVETRLGDPSKAREKLGRVPTARFDDLEREMVEADYHSARRDELVKSAGLQADDYNQ